MRLLVSVRNVDEALSVAACDGIGLLDLKEPSHGALGALPLQTVRAIVTALRASGCRRSVSATVGDDVPLGDPLRLARTIEAVAGCGVDLVKVGVAAGPQAEAALDALAAIAARGIGLVPVLLADRGLDFALVESGCRPEFAALMLDTADKRRGSLFDALPEASLARVVALARRAAQRIGLAGSLRLGQLEPLRRLAPDFAGFRSAVCREDRAGTLDPELLAALVARLQPAVSERE